MKVYDGELLNNAPETLVRLVEMGMDPISFSESIAMVIAQRLIRILCNKCKKEHKPGKEEYEKLKETYGPEWYDKHKMDKIHKKTTLRKNCLNESPINSLTIIKRTRNITKFAIIATTKTEYAAHPIFSIINETTNIIKLIEPSDNS